MLSEDDEPAALEAHIDARDTRLDKALAAAYPTLSRARVQALLAEGAVTRDGQPVSNGSAKAQPGLYSIILPPVTAANPQAEHIPLTVLYEDDDLIVIDKPAGMAAHPAPGNETGTLVNALLHHCAGSLSGIGGVARPGIVHRLDKDTSGVMVAAKSEAAHTALTNMFAAHDIERAYLAVTRGAPRPLIGRIETNIGRSPNDRKKMAVMKDKHFRADHWSNDTTNGESAETAGKIAITNYRGIETFGRLDSTGSQPAAALVECRLETGRTHQIRVHMAHIGAPVLGDQTYGKHRWLKADGKGAAFERATATAKAFERQALHAAVLGFVHPITGKQLRFERPPPADMSDLIDALRAMPS